MGRDHVSPPRACRVHRPAKLKQRGRASRQSEHRDAEPIPRLGKACPDPGADTLLHRKLLDARAAPDRQDWEIVSPARLWAAVMPSVVSWVPIKVGSLWPEMVERETFICGFSVEDGGEGFFVGPNQG